MKNLLVILITAVVFVMGCQPAEKPLTAEEKTEIQTEISSLTDTLIQKQLSLDFDAVFPYWLLDDNFSFISDGEAIIGGDNFKKILEEFDGSIKEYINVETSDPHILALDRNLALYIYKFDESYITSTNDTLSSKGTTSLLYKKKDGVWKIIHQNAFHQPSE